MVIFIWLGDGMKQPNMSEKLELENDVTDLWRHDMIPLCGAEWWLKTPFGMNTELL